MRNGTVSVVIPAYNPRSDWLAEAIASAVNQDPAPIEILVVDDGSDVAVSCDRSLVRVIRQANAGVASARNHGVREAGGEFVAFLDQDDCWLPGKLAAQLEVMSNEVGLCSTAFVQVRGERILPGWGGPAGSYSDLVRGNSVAASTVLVRRNTLLDVGGFPIDLPMVDDWDTWLRILRSSEARHVPVPLMRYRVHSDNASRSYGAMYLGSARVLWRHRHARWNAVRGLARMGQIYGSQAFDAFRESKHPRDLTWALLLRPRYVFGQALRRSAGRHGRPVA